MKKNAKPMSAASLRFRNFLIAFCFVAAALGLSAYFLFMCRVETVLVKNTVTVPQPVIMDAANVKAGRHLFAISRAKIERAIIDSSPYVKSVTLERKLPSTLHICIEDYKTAYYIEHKGEYYLLSDKLFVIEKTTPEDALDLGAAPLMLPELKEYKKPEDENEPFEEVHLRETLAFKVKTDLAWCEKLLDAIADTDFADMITSVDLADPFDLTVIVSEKYTLHLGNEKNFAAKLARCENAIHYLTENMYGVRGIIHATDNAPVTFEITGVAE